MIQFERDQISSPERHQDHPLVLHSSADEDLLDLALVIKPSVPSTTEADAANLVNSLSLPSRGLKEAKKKRSGSTELATSGSKRVSTPDAQTAVANNTMTAPSQVHTGELKRPPPRLCTGKPIMPVDQKNIFEIPLKPSGEKQPPNQAPKGLKKRGRPKTNTKPSDIQSEREQPQHSGRNSHDGVENSTPSWQPEGRRLRSQKPVPASSGRMSPHPVHKPEVARGQKSDRDNIVQGSQSLSGGDAIDNEQSAVGPRSAEPLEETKHVAAGDSEPEGAQQDTGENAFVSKVSTGSQVSAQQLENVQEVAGPIDNANGNESEEHDGNEEDYNSENDEQGDDGQESEERKGLRHGKRRRKKNIQKAKLSTKIDAASMQRQREKRKREDIAILQHIEDDCNRGHATWWREELATTYEPNCQSAATNREAVENWSEEQKQALVTELVRKEHWNLTAEEMFLKALNAPLLQNKLPEHIRQGALYYKAAIEKEANRNRMPRWVSSIE
ncbi:MAG: hypothetical protein L6R36_002781 [Xanthoria steineri]|nr:MAG: hypothetical protein L6R36_002781 [Xanthoria steineri]